MHWARQVLAFVEIGDALSARLSAVERLAAYQPIDTVALRRLIAEKIIKMKKYPF
jgi:hypothetical protein